MTAAEFLHWLQARPDHVVYMCGCICINPVVAAASQTPPMDCPKHTIAQWPRFEQFYPGYSTKP